MYFMAIERAERTFAANQRLRAETAALRAEASALVFTYRRHRLSELAGGIDASDDDRARREYDLTAGPSGLRLDAPCCNVFMEQWRAIAPCDSPDAGDG
jgi:hypothetical protein